MPIDLPDPAQFAAGPSPGEQAQMKAAYMRSRSLNPAALAGMLTTDKSMQQTGNLVQQNQSRDPFKKIPGGLLAGGNFIGDNGAAMDRALRYQNNQENRKNRLQRARIAASDRAARRADSKANRDAWREQRRVDGILSRADARIQSWNAKNRPDKVSDKTREILATGSQTLDFTLAHMEAFNPKYTDTVPLGVGKLGEVQDFIVKNFQAYGSPDEVSKAAWWNDYGRENGLKARHDLFGATLTGNEKASWDKIELNQGMKYGEIRSQLERRADLLEKILHKRARAATINYRSPKVISELTGYEEDELGYETDYSSLNSLRTALESIGYELHTGEDGVRAIPKAQQQAPEPME